MIKRLAVLLFSVIPLMGMSQVFGNEWIDYNQRYLKIPVRSEGIYRINFSELDQAFSQIGLSLSSTDPQDLQLFVAGQEQHIHVEGEVDGVFDSTDFILFYGRGNDGWLDSSLYIRPEYQVNPYLSLFNDTAWYYLTINTTGSPLRYFVDGNTNFGPKTAEPYTYSVNVVSPASYYNEGFKDNAGVSSPLYQEGEGWVGPVFFGTIKRSVTLDSRNAYTGTGNTPATVTTNSVGLSNAAGNPNHGLTIQYLSGSNQATVVDTTFNGYAMLRHQFEIPNNQLAASTRIEYAKKALSPEPPSDYQAGSFARIEYQYNNSLAGVSQRRLEVTSNNDTSFLSFSGAVGAFLPLVFDLEKGVINTAIQSGSDFEFLLQPGARRPFFLTNNVNVVANIKPSYSSSRGDGWMTDLSALNTDSAFLIVTTSQLRNGADQFSSYKRGRGFNSVLVEVEDLYEQFAYGIPKHPASIRSYLAYLENKPNSSPRYLFLIGKSVKETLVRFNSSNQSRNLVPTIAFPPADNLFTMPTDNQTFNQKTPTGRLAANSNQQILDYLDKVMDLDAANQLSSPDIENKLWTKIGLHFAGGSDINQQNSFSGYLANYERYWEDTVLGGSIENFKRFSSGSVQSLNFDSVKIWIDNGVSLLSFFGHGSGGQLGINIGDPGDYDNRGKYPIFLANSCNVGDYHLPNANATTVNERWIMEPNAGAVGFIATTSAGFVSPLNTWSTQFYQRLSNTRYGEGIGDIIQSIIAQLGGSSPLLNNTCMEMNLHGDPSIELYPKEKPDFAVRDEDVIAPAFVSVDQRTLQLQFTLYNIGLGIDTLVPIQIKRKFPSGADTIYHDTIQGINFSYKGSIELFIANDESVGENRFSLSIDPDNTIDEIYPSVNNSTNEIRINITSDDLIPVHPLDFAIEPKLDVTLSASTADPRAPQKTFQFEIDTSSNFNSPVKKSGSVTGSGGLVQWDPNLSGFTDSTVFYWRCAPLPTSGLPKWRMQSFQFIPGQSGWSQYHFPQFSANRRDQLELNLQSRQFEFSEGKVNISASNQGNPAVIEEFFTIRWSINGNIQGRPGVCRGQRSMLISVIDPQTFKSWETRHMENGQIVNPNNHFGNYNDGLKGNCGGLDYNDNKFQFLVRDSVQMDSMIYMINQVVPDSFYILVMSSVNAEFQNSNYWKNRHYQVFEDLGADSIRHIAGDLPYILFAQKGNKNRAIEIIGEQNRAVINLSTFIETNQNKGWMASVSLPPSNDYKALHWFFTGNNPEDSINLTLRGTDAQGQRVDLLHERNNRFDFNNIKTEVPNINNYVDLELEAEFYDSLANIPPQLSHWFLLMDESLELAIDAGSNFSFHSDTLQQGEELKLGYDAVNLSSSQADSLLIRYTLFDINNRAVWTGIEKKAAFVAYGRNSILFTHSTNDLRGHFTLLVDINPLDTGWQREVQHFNNQLSVSFFVKADLTNPLLDVTFDGRHILDGDIISSRPEILATLNDENGFRPIEDTSAFQVFLTDPRQNKRRLYFGYVGEEYSLNFEPGSSQNNTAQFRLSPILNLDGDYLLEVEAQDASSNRSGTNSYKVRFEVINRSTITQILNYPNPFSTSTRFVFTLTGSQVPDYFRIQIFTATGKVVREIDRHELGDIRIGNNITDYAWDGTDEFGDRLANGVYFYRVITKIAGESIEHRQSQADSYFKKGIGKMYLMR